MLAEPHTMHGVQGGVARPDIQACKWLTFAPILTHSSKISLSFADGELGPSHTLDQRENREDDAERRGCQAYVRTAVHEQGGQNRQTHKAPATHRAFK